MKFGHNLVRNMIPEWSPNYINYKGLKKIIKATAADAKAGQDVDLTGFFQALDSNVEKVDTFYNKRYADGSRRLELLQSRYSKSEDGLSALDLFEIDELIGALLEIRSKFRNLQWFGEVNRRGFVKITKKMDKRVPDMTTQEQYIAAKVDTKLFATNSALFQAISETNDWISVIAEVKEKKVAGNDDNDVIGSIHYPMTKTTSKSVLRLPHDLIDGVDAAVKADDSVNLMQKCKEAKLNHEDPSVQTLFVSLLQRSISLNSRACISYLLDQIKSLDELDDINSRNCLHQLVITIGRIKSRVLAEAPSAAIDSEGWKYITPAASPPSGPAKSMLKESDLLGEDDESVKLLAYVLESLKPHQRSALMSKDSYGRLPLHYAAQFGFVVICKLVMKYMQIWDQFHVENGIDALEWQDGEGLAPLHLSVIGGHPLTTQALLKAENWRGSNSDRAAMRRDISKSSAVLALATKSNFTVIVKLLVDAGVDINWQDETGETALHIAARFGNQECAKILLQGTSDQKADYELAESSFAWTPLHVACVDGHLSVVELLIAAGAELDKKDASGWTAKEHAALRGHITIAERLAEELLKHPKNPKISAAKVLQTIFKAPQPEVSSTNALRSQRPGSPPNPGKPVKKTGHHYLENESLVLVSLGSMDMRKEVPAVKLESIPITEAHSTQLDTALSIVVSSTGAAGEPVVIDLPVQENISTEPMVFKTSDFSKVKLYFDIIPTYSGSEKHVLGRGVALLASMKHNIGNKRMNLQGDVSVPIMSRSTLDVIGCVNFNFLIITPFSHPNMGAFSEQTYWKEIASTMLIGHRGLGKNQTSVKSLQLGENTLQSFIAAANLGANYVEFDVQLTKDLVPVIYHDFLVSETGIDAPVHTLTLEQFLHVNDPTPRSSRPPSPPQESQHMDPKMKIVRGADRQRSNSLGPTITDFDMSERMKHTRDFKSKGYKANSRGNFIQAPFTTLEEMLIKLPQDVGFNIEMKYPMLSESEDEEMDTYAIELNIFVDTVLKKVFDLSEKRKIIFSSFNPDICLLLSFKQPNIPILFLTEGGTSAVSDIRASSLQEAIRFASRWNLLGIVSAAEPFYNSPRLVRVVKESGLVCVSYGTLNNDPVKVQYQLNEGIDAVIVDSVLEIRNRLTQHAKSTAEAAEAA